MKTIIKILIIVVIFNSCSSKQNSKEKVIQKKDLIEITTKKSVEILKSEKVAEPTKLFYYFVERDSKNNIIDSILIMTPMCYDYQIKKPNWSNDSTSFVFENLLTIDGDQQIEIFDVIKRKKVFKTFGILFPEYNKEKSKTTDDQLGQILFHRISYSSNSNDIRLSIFVLNSLDYSIDSITTINTKSDGWFMPGLIKSDWTNKEFQIVHTPVYDRLKGMLIRDTLNIAL